MPAQIPSLEQLTCLSNNTLCYANGTPVTNVEHVGKPFIIRIGVRPMSEEERERAFREEIVEKMQSPGYARANAYVRGQGEVFRGALGIHGVAAPIQLYYTYQSGSGIALG